MILLPDHSQSLIHMEKLPKALVSLRTERGRIALCLFVLCLFVLYLFILCLFVVVDHFGESTNCQNFQVPDVLDETTLVMPTTRPATHSRAQNMSPEHEPLHHHDFFTASRWYLRFVRLLRVLDLRYVYILHSSLRHADITLTQPTEPFSLHLLHLPCASCNTKHCRGCIKTTPYPPNCSCHQSWPVHTCYPSMCAIALFKVLCSFDKEYARLGAQIKGRGRSRGHW